eukprot:9974322-Karenia_brevis.AAC.1
MRYHSESRDLPHGQLIKLIKMHWGSLNEIPLRIGPRIARREFVYGQLIRPIRMHWGPLNEEGAQSASRISRWPADQVHEIELGPTE